MTAKIVDMVLSKNRDKIEIYLEDINDQRKKYVKIIKKEGNELLGIFENKDRLIGTTLNYLRDYLKQVI